MPALRWTEASCSPNLRDGLGALAEAQERTCDLLCGGIASLAGAALPSACDATPFWRAKKPWRKGECCSHAIQFSLTQLYASRADFGAVGDEPGLGELLFARSVSEVAARVLRSYWPLIPTEGRLATFLRDVRVMCAIALSLGGGEAVASTDDLEVERRRLRHLALWLLALYCLHSAPLPSLISFVRSGSVPDANAADVDVTQIGDADLVQDSAAASASLERLALPADVTAYTPPTVKLSHAQKEDLGPALAMAHMQAQAASKATMPEMDWSSLLAWDVFPLRGSAAAVVHHALRRVPMIQPDAMKDAPADEMSAREELAALLRP